MNLDSYLAFLKKIASAIPFNVFDYVFFISLALYVFEDATFGVIPAGISFLATVFSFFAGLALYHPVSSFIQANTALTKGLSDAVAFLLATVISFFVFSLVLSFLRKKYFPFTPPKNIDRIGGAIFGFLSFFFISSFAVAILLSFPVSGVIKTSIADSVMGRFLSVQTRGFEGYVRQIFGGAISDTINFLTVKPDSEETVGLNFKTTNYTVDEKSEKEMLRQVNAQRAKVGLPPLIADEMLQEAARDHAADMLEKGYFSHYSLEGYSPFDRMESYGIVYQYAGENLAFAPDVSLAMDGLMKSPGHRANILSQNFGKAGIGVLDAGIYGKMFVQEFTD